MKRGVSVSAVQGLQRNPLIIYPGYPTLQLEARLPLAFMTFSVKKSFPHNGFTGTGDSNPRFVCICACARARTQMCDDTRPILPYEVRRDRFPLSKHSVARLSTSLLSARTAFPHITQVSRSFGLYVPSKQDLITLLRFRHLAKHGA